MSELLDRLTRRERQVLAQLTHGRTNAQIAAVLGIGVGTVKIHVEHLLIKLGATNRTQAAAIAAGAARQRLEQQAEADQNTLGRALIERTTEKKAGEL